MACNHIPQSVKNLTEKVCDALFDVLLKEIRLGNDVEVEAVDRMFAQSLNNYNEVNR